jgi:AraC-like DNA-binding protein
MNLCWVRSLRRGTRCWPRMRRLIACGREFTRPHPYRLEDIARAAGMSISGIRTAYDEDEIARLTGATPFRPTAFS